MVATLRTRKSAAFGQLVECRFDAASPAGMPHAEPDFHDMIQASVVIWEAGEKLFDGKTAGQGTHPIDAPNLP